MMKYSVGYQITQDNQWVRYLLEQRKFVAEVYFPWDGFASGRDEGDPPDGMTRFEAETQKRTDLKRLFQAGISMNLLLNGNCYGAESLARSFFIRLGEMVQELQTEYGVGSITTTSPVIAKFIKQNFEKIEVRASVNMEIGTEQGMKYLSEWFDGFYLQREHNRNFPYIRKIKKWCDANGKKLFLLANSGCLNHCSTHHFHDNLVAHHNEIKKMDNAYDFQGVCWDYLRDKKNLDSYLIDTNFIRPEDIRYYEGLFDCVKLATRVNAHPERILRAYIEGRYIGSVMNLLEPDHSGAILPLLVENSSIPHDFMDHVGNCMKNCESCNYCRQILRKSLVMMEDRSNVNQRND